MRASYARLVAHLHAVETTQAPSSTRLSLVAYIRLGRFRNLATFPLIYSLIVPLALLDLWIFGYQWLCFPVYGIARVSRRRYFVFDRHQLDYLNGIEKISCTFCSYANGVIAFAREVAACTEHYWCPIKHARTPHAPHQHYRHFLDYGDASRYRGDLMDLRGMLRPPAPGGASDAGREAVCRHDE